ncbi:hypothetical protein ACIP3B_28045 [Streptomyces anulatus]|uniref:hypothetical protein n=1 Tax=Streptomyces anulatus TaxID=1892 RepID=UPI0033CD7BA4
MSGRAPSPCSAGSCTRTIRGGSQHALVACGAASARAERALGERSVASLPAVQTRLAAAVVELREADDAAAGELWSAEIDPTELAAAECRAHLLLERLARPR